MKKSKPKKRGRPPKTRKERKKMKDKDQDSKKADKAKADQASANAVTPQTAQASPGGIQYPSQQPHSTEAKVDPQNPSHIPVNTPLAQIADPVAVVNEKEPPVPSKRDQPAIPLEDDLRYQIQTIINDAHRGINPDITKLDGDKKAKLIEYLDQESENERVFRDPSRELVRNKLRDLLGAKKKDDKDGAKVQADNVK